MKGISPVFKEWLQVAEKFLLVITLAGGIAASVYKGAEYLSAKSAVVQAQAVQETETANALQLLTRTYSDLLKELDRDIREIDQKLGEEVFTGTVGWNKMLAIRSQKVADRNQLLSTLGSQVVQLKGSEPNQAANNSLKADAASGAP